MSAEAHVKAADFNEGVGRWIVPQQPTCTLRRRRFTARSLGEGGGDVVASRGRPLSPLRWS